LLANLLDAGRGVARDLTRVRDLWRIACDARDERACEPLGDERGVRNLAIQEVELGTRAQGRHACDRGEAWACYREAFRMLREGNDVTGDPRAVGFFFARASTLFGEACERGDADACRIAGDLRKVGLGFPRDVAGALSAYDEAARLEDQACDKGDAEHCAKLANMYADGRAVAADPKRAVEAFDRAKALLATSCNQRKASDASKLACDRLGRLLREGTVVPPVVSPGPNSPSTTPR
jgi:TPR repeat protein